MKATYEEKTYENYFNAELSNRSDIFFPCGQVQEGFLGFDSSADSRSRRLWRRLGFPFWFSPHFAGASLREIADEMEHILNIVIEDIPRLKSNILFQYKRPEYITINLGTEWGLWNRPYFRYDIYDKQQQLLNHIHTKFGDRVLIVYASPAILDVNDLVEKKIRRNIIEHSNFTKACDLNAHHRNTYISSGTYSIACSEPEEIKSIDIIKELAKVGEIGNSNDYKNNRDFIIDFRKEIEEIVNQNNYYKQSFQVLNSLIDKVKSYELFYSFLIMNNFREITGSQWLVKV